MSSQRVASNQLTAEDETLSKVEVRVLTTFRQYMIRPGQMLCFDGQSFKKNRRALKILSDRGLLIEETFKGAYTLTEDGFRAVQKMDID